MTWLPTLDSERPGSHFFVQYKRKGKSGQVCFIQICNVVFAGETTFESTPMEEENDFILVRGLEHAVIYDVRVVAVDGKHERPSSTQEISMGSLGMNCNYLLFSFQDAIC